MADSRCKYYKQKKQVSYDNGVTWADVIPYEYQKGELYETESQDCGYVPPVTQYRWIKTNDTTCVEEGPEVLYRWVNMDASVDYYCEGTTKYYKQKKQVSFDGGQTWRDVVPAEYQKGGVAQRESTDCGYVPPTPTGKKLVATYTGGTREVECNSSTTLRSGETKPSGYDYHTMTSAVIGNCVTSIGRIAFSGCSSLTSVTIGSSVTTIENFALGYCSGLTSVTIPDSVTAINWGAFIRDSSLISVTIGNGVQSIGTFAFAYCTSLTSVTIPDSVTSIDVQAFSGCTSLTSVIIGNGVTSIGYYTFGHCTSLTSVTIGSGVTELGGFGQCTSLKRVNSNVDGECNIPNSVTTIGTSAFQYCSGLTSVTIPSGVTTIEGFAFEHCSGLTSINVPNSVISIDWGAFSGCTSLTSVTIGSGITEIGGYSFADCSSLTSATIYAVTPPTDAYGAFGLYSRYPIYVPAQSVEAYKSAWRYQYKTRIQPIP